MAVILYSLVVHLYGLVIRVAALQNQKAKDWVSGRKNWRKHLNAKLQNMQAHKKIWVHCASYGEFEQGRPLMEEIKKTHPDHKIILTFFSPSGYEAFKSWSGADLIMYLPLDTKKNARDFIRILQPHMAIFIKYEFWLHFLNRLKKQQIQTFLVSAVFKPQHPFFKWYGGIFRRSLLTFKQLFVQDNVSKDLLSGIGILNVQVVGDTRFDRVLDIKAAAYSDPVLEAFKGNAKLIVAGSTWPKDETLVLKAFNDIKHKGCKLVIAPHEVETRFTINTIKKINEYGFKYSIYMQDPATDVDVMIIDTVGLLSKLYRFADTAYVGGCFNGGLHNILEPTVYGTPVSFYGENYEKFNEAIELKNLKVAQTVMDAAALSQVWEQQLFDIHLQTQVKQSIEAYFEQKGHVTQKVLKHLSF